MTDSTSHGLADIDAVFGEFRRFVDRNRSAEAQRMAWFLAAYRKCLVDSVSSGRFNILDITGVGNDEVKHSSILAWLLAPQSTHACGTRFLKLFLDAAGISVSQEHLRDCYVRTEFFGNESIIDILVCKPGAFIVYIENKTLSAEGVNQVDREYRDMVRVGTSIRVPDGNMFPVFLTPSGHPPTSGDPRRWHSVSYRALAQKLKAVLPTLADRKIAFLVEDLIEQYNRWSCI